MPANNAGSPSNHEPWDFSRRLGNKSQGAAARLEDLAIPARNRLELLKGDRAGRYSIRINAQYRVASTHPEGGRVIG